MIKYGFNSVCVCVFYRIEHLSLNMAMQLLVGVPLEMVHGALRIGLVYVCGVLAGGPVLSHTHATITIPLMPKCSCLLSTHSLYPRDKTNTHYRV